MTSEEAAGLWSNGAVTGGTVSVGTGDITDFTQTPVRAASRCAGLVNLPRVCMSLCKVSFIQQNHIFQDYKMNSGYT